MKTFELTGAALDWAVAKCEGQDPLQYETAEGAWHTGNWLPSIDWSQGGPIIERERIGVRHSDGQWIAEWWSDNSGMTKNPRQGFTHNRYMAGPTPLIAAMRCYVASKCGESVSVPEGLE